MASGTYLSGVGTTDLPIYSSGVSDILLDSIRDATFLGSGSNDFGLGVTDDPKFFFAGYVDPSTKTARPYPVKFFWLGSPAGTNDKDDVFSIYMADVVPGAFQFGALPSAWLANPRLVLSEAQAKLDVVAWFDANYPGGGGTGGVGASNSGSSSAYGDLAGGSSAVGNVSGMSSIDGEYWPILDLVDGSLLLYFSFKTPNCNTLSIYCYRLSSPEVPASAATADFVGGLSGFGWFGPKRPSGTPLKSPVSVGVLSSHRFSLLSPDPLVTEPRAGGTQNAVMAYSFGAFDGVTPDHGAFINASVATDVHANPLSPGTVLAFAAGEIDNGKQYPVDKLGTISATPMVDRYSAGYALIYNAPSDRDLRARSDAVVISSMHLRVMYLNLATGTVGYGSTPLRYAASLPNVGFCRPQFTHLPDGIPKLLYANFTFDQHLNLGYEYVPADLLSPDRQRSVIQTGGGASLCYAYGKRRARMRAIPHKGHVPPIGSNPSPSNIVSAVQVVEYFAYNVSDGGFQEAVQPTLLHFSQESPRMFSGQSESTASLEWHLEDLPPFFGLRPVGGGNKMLFENVQIEFFD